MAKQGKHCVNHSKGKNSHLLISDNAGKLTNATVDRIRDDDGNTWEFDQLAATQSGKRLPLRVRRITGAVRKRADGDLGTLTVTVTDSTGTTDIPVPVTYVEDPAAPC